MANDSDAKDPKYTKITAEADGFVIVVPEYNHSFPGSLKRMLDSEYGNYRRKPVVLAGVSSGAFGGVRAIHSLVPVLRELGLVVLHADLHFPRVQDLFDEKGKLNDDNYKQRIKKSLDELLWFSKALSQK